MKMTKFIVPALICLCLAASAFADRVLWTLKDAADNVVYSIVTDDAGKASILCCTTTNVVLSSSGLTIASITLPDHALEAADLPIMSPGKILVGGTTSNAIVTNVSGAVTLNSNGVTTVTSVNANAIGSTNIAANSILAEDLAALSVDTAALTNGAVNSLKIANSSVSNVDLAASDILLNNRIVTAQDTNAWHIETGTITFGAETGNSNVFSRAYATPGGPRIFFTHTGDNTTYTNNPIIVFQTSTYFCVTSTVAATMNTNEFIAIGY